MEIGGAEGIRTLDPHVANVVLSQLSYRPTECGRRILLAARWPSKRYFLRSGPASPSLNHALSASA